MKTAAFALTQREREVAELVAQGLTNRQIAAKLFISERTAEYHVEQIRNKLGFHARTQIAAWVGADPPAPRPATAPPVPARGGGVAWRSPVRPSLRVAVFGLAAAVAMAATGLAAVTLFNRTPQAPATSAARVVQFSVTTGQPTAWTTPISSQASNLAVGNGAIWTVSYRDRVLSRINPKTSAMVGSYGTAAPIVGITVAEGFVWIATAFGDHALEPFDPKTNQFGQPVSLGGEVALQGIAYGWNSLWVTDKNNDLVYRIDPSTSTVISRIAVGDGPEGIAVDSAGVWVANGVDATISRIDPNTSRVVATIGLRGTPTAIAAGPSGVWIVSEPASLVVRIDSVANQQLEIPIDAHPSGIAVAPSAVWVVDQAGGRIIRIDPTTDRALSTVAAGGRVDAITADAESVWVSVHGT